MKYSIRLIQATLCMTLCYLGGNGINPVQAQVVPDRSLGTGNSSVRNGQTIRGGPAQLIQGGTQRGQNLFHSFSDFNINAGQGAYFDPSASVNNILSRITGNKASNINGTLGVLGAANLFLLNPNGVVFGESASLDLEGSLFVTSAEQFQFSDGSVFSASTPHTPSILSVTVPVGLGFGSNPGDIRTNNSNLSLAPEQSLTLVGGGVHLQGGSLTAPDGQIALLSADENQQLAVRQKNGDWTFEGLEQFRDIQLSQGAIAETSGEGGGRIDIQGHNIRLQDGAGLIADTFGTSQGRGVNIQATGTLDLSGKNQADQPSLLAVTNFGAGNSGNLRIQAKEILLRDGALIAVDTNSTGDSGDVYIQAKTIELSGFDTEDFGSLIGVASFSTGKSGDLEIVTDHLRLKDQAYIDVNARGDTQAGDLILRAKTLSLEDGAQLGTGTFGAGDSGDMSLFVTDSIDIQGTTRAIPTQQNGQEILITFSSGLFASVESGSTGHGGQLRIETGNLKVTKGGKIATNTLGTGNAGNISIKAEQILVQDAFVDEVGSRSGITSSVELSGIGQGGNITIEAQKIRVLDGGNISASTVGQGQAGNVIIRTSQLQVNGSSPEGLPSQVAALSNNDFAAGSVILSAQTIQIEQNGELTVSGQGNAGNLTIRNAESLVLSDGGRLRAETQTGNQGNIDVDAKKVQLRRGGQITSNASKEANGGNIGLTAETLMLLEGSEITATAIQGHGGNIHLTTQGLFQSPDSKISASSDFGVNGIVELSILDLDPQNTLVTPTIRFESTDQLVANSCISQRNRQQGKFVMSGNGGIPQNPLETLPLNFNILPALIAPSETTQKNPTQNFTPKRAVSQSVNEANQLQWQPNGTLRLIAAKVNPEAAESLTCSAPHASSH